MISLYLGTKNVSSLKFFSSIISQLENEIYLTVTLEVTFRSHSLGTEGNSMHSFTGKPSVYEMISFQSIMFGKLVVWQLYVFL